MLKERTKQDLINYKNCIKNDLKFYQNFKTQYNQNDQPINNPYVPFLDHLHPKELNLSKMYYDVKTASLVIIHITKKESIRMYNLYKSNQLKYPFYSDSFRKERIKSYFIHELISHRINDTSFISISLKEICDHIINILETLIKYIEKDLK